MSCKSFLASLRLLVAPRESFLTLRELMAVKRGWLQHRFRPVKRRWALVETNPPRNIRLQSHEDDEAQGQAHALRPETPNRTRRIARSAHV
jgi:hypothetical protein